MKAGGEKWRGEERGGRNPDPKVASREKLAAKAASYHRGGRGKIENLPEPVATRAKHRGVFLAR